MIKWTVFRMMAERGERVVEIVRLGRGYQIRGLSLHYDFNDVKMARTFAGAKRVARKVLEIDD